MHRIIQLGLLALLISAGRAAEGYNFFTLAGRTGESVTIDGALGAARFRSCAALTLESDTSAIVGDLTCVRRVDLTSGAVTTIAGITSEGSQDGIGAAARFISIGGVVADGAGNIYIADSGAHVIKRLARDGSVTTIAGVARQSGQRDGNGSAALFSSPRGLALDAEGNLYVADSGNHAVRRITPSRDVTTFAGYLFAGGTNDGTGDTARFEQPTRLAFDRSGNLFVVDPPRRTLRKITPAAVVTTLTSFEPGVAGFIGIASDATGAIYCSDGVVLQRMLPGGPFTTLAGARNEAYVLDGPVEDARFAAASGLAIDSQGNLCVGEGSTLRIGLAWRLPAFTTVPQGTTLSVGQTVELSVAVTGYPTPSVQWYRNGSAVAGGGGARLTLTGSTATAGTYTVVATNRAGAVTSAAATISVAAEARPTITAPPQATVITSSAGATLTVSASGTGALTYQWLRGGQAIAGATSATYVATAPGDYAVVVTNATGSVTSAAVPVTSNTRLVNIATRGPVNGSDGLVAGFVVGGGSGSATKQLLIRGVGPTLGSFGVPGTLARPSLTVFRGSVAAFTNAGWETAVNASEIASVGRAVGAFPLATGSADAAVLVSLEPGAYTVQLDGVSGAAGASLVEVYEAQADAARLINLSTRGRVTAAETLTAGVVITGGLPVRLMIRAIGPALGQFGLPGTLSRTRLTVFNGSTVVASNAGWSTAANADEIATVATAVGAFPLANNSEDSVVLEALPPGNYTAQVSGASGAIGVALVEIYQVP